MGARHEPAILAGTGTITLIDGLTFAISDASGDMPDGLDGLIADDTRHLSLLAVRLDGEPMIPLGAAILTPSSARFRGNAAPGHGHSDAPLEVDRRRRVAPGLLEDDLALSWWAESPCPVAVDVAFDADFADIFQIRGMEAGLDAVSEHVRSTTTADGARFFDDETGLATVVRFEPPPESRRDGGVRWVPELRRGAPWHLRMSVRVENSAVPPAGRRELHPSTSISDAPEVGSDPPDLGRACRRALTDLDALALPDVLDGGRRLVAAGIPWFVALFGRDSAITGHQARAFLPAQMLDTLAALAARQGRVSDPGNEEEPGKILHEVRLTPRPWLGHGTAAGARPYYGSIDATPLFLVLLGTAARWGAPRDAVADLLPAARAALAWMRGPADPDDDGLLEYRPIGTRSLSNQSWKDSENAVQFPDGTLATGPIAMAEVQGYAYRARRELAQVLRMLGHDAEADAVDAEAASLRDLVRERYWCPGAGGAPGFFALALDGAKRQVASVASNMGHLLWCGVPSDAEAVDVGRHLTGPGLASGWGLRTLSREMDGFNPISYHVGSVWPHDTGLACEGLRRFGLDGPALSLAEDLMGTLVPFDHRLPELFGGHEREPGDVPVPYPTACRPQAWAAGVPLQLATMFLGIEPDVPAGRVSLCPALPAGLEFLEVKGIRFPGGRLSVQVDRRAGLTILEAPEDLVVEVRRPGPGVSSTAGQEPRTG